MSECNMGHIPDFTPEAIHHEGHEVIEGVTLNQTATVSHHEAHEVIEGVTLFQTAIVPHHEGHQVIEGGEPEPNSNCYSP